MTLRTMLGSLQTYQNCLKREPMASMSGSTWMRVRGTQDLQNPEEMPVGRLVQDSTPLEPPTAGCLMLAGRLRSFLFPLFLSHVAVSNYSDQGPKKTALLEVEAG